MALAAPSAALAGPTVTVRIEGASDTLVARTAVTTNATDVVKDGTHCLQRPSAGGALEQATSGAWSGPWYDAFSDYGLETVKGEFHSLVPPNTVYWGFFLNGYSAPSGICSTTLTQGDQVVFAAVDAAASGGLLEPQRRARHGRARRPIRRHGQPPGDDLRPAGLPARTPRTRPRTRRSRPARRARRPGPTARRR